MQFKILAIPLLAAAATAQTQAIDYAQLTALQIAFTATCVSVGQQLSQLSGTYDALSSTSSGQFDNVNKQMDDFEYAGSDFVKKCSDIAATIGSISGSISGSAAGDFETPNW